MRRSRAFWPQGGLFSEGGQQVETCTARNLTGLKTAHIWRPFSRILQRCNYWSFAELKPNFHILSLSACICSLELEHPIYAAFVIKIIFTSQNGQAFSSCWWYVIVCADFLLFKFEAERLTLISGRIYVLKGSKSLVFTDMFMTRWLELRH